MLRHVARYLVTETLIPKIQHAPPPHLLYGGWGSACRTLLCHILCVILYIYFSCQNEIKTTRKQSCM